MLKSDLIETVITAVVREPLAAYRYSTPCLEQALAQVRSLYGGGAEGPHFKALRKAEDEMAACLRARARNLALTSGPLSTPKPAPTPDPPPSGGQRVKVKRPAPVLPSGGSAVDLL